MISRCFADPDNQQGLVRKDVTFGQDQGLLSLPALHLARSNLVAYAVLLSPTLRQLLNSSFENFSLYTENQVPSVHKFFISVESCRVKSSSSELFIFVINFQVYIEKFAVCWCTLIPLVVTWQSYGDVEPAHINASLCKCSSISVFLTDLSRETKRIWIFLARWCTETSRSL